MKKSLYFFVIMVFLLQSCYTYKDAPFESLEVNKNYIVQIKDGKEIRVKFREVGLDTLVMKTNNKYVKIPTNRIKSIKRQKVSALKVIGGVTAAVGGMILFIDNTKEPPIIPQ
ncbi:hypothetical protein ABN763_07775 [Spongiivirga sp. MCCC 1A20706]|uniref:hypothetical protein n=1 Tax=Spongiivirga sp. MCCC 1A20706 TaxID=3160963 RepID=UPI003977476D